jgi:hypothetical protein
MADTLSRLVQAGTVSIVGVALNGAAKHHDPESSRKKRNWLALPYAAYLRLDRSTPEPDAFRMVDISSLAAVASVRQVTPRQTVHSDYFNDEDIAWLRSLNGDIGLRLGYRILRGDVLHAARHGILSFHHGDNRHYRGGPAGFWEVFEKAPLTGAILQRLSEDLDGGEVLYRTCVPTHPFSAARNRHALYWAAAQGLSTVLQRIRNGAAKPASHDAVIPYASRMYRAPGPLDALRAIGNLITRRVFNRMQSSRRTLQWHIGFRLNPLQRGEAAPDLSPHRLKIVSSPLGALWADPFVAKDGDNYWIFFEEVPPAESRGRISVARIGSNGELKEIEPVLSRPHHLSYPCVFRWEGGWYMAPESYDAGHQEIFRANRFPFEWEKIKDIFTGEPIVDPTIFQHEGRWWLFASRPTPQTLIGEELLAWHADSPLEEWIPHPMNPLRAGVDGSRPAGLPFRVADRLIRPGQLGAPRYGAGVRFFEITLTTESYTETEVGEIEPRWASDVFGFHTINHEGQLTVGDVLLNRRR